MPIEINKVTHVEERQPHPVFFSVNLLVWKFPHSLGVPDTASGRGCSLLVSCWRPLLCLLVQLLEEGRPLNEFLGPAEREIHHTSSSWIVCPLPVEMPRVLTMDDLSRYLGRIRTCKGVLEGRRDLLKRFVRRETRQWVGCGVRSESRVANAVNADEIVDRHYSRA